MKIWQVKVYDKPENNYSLYHFQYKLDVEQSINSTWEKFSPKPFWRENMADGSIVLVSNDTRKLLLEAVEIEFNLETTPTHF